MKKILLFIDSLIAGGAQRQLVGLACLLKERGYTVKVATYYNHPFYKYLLDEKEIEYECFNVNSKLSWISLIRCIHRFQADALISYQTVPNGMACVAAKICGIRLIVSERNTHQRVSMKDKIIFNLYRWADCVVANSYSEKYFIDRHFPFLQKKTYAISNFVDLQRFQPCEKQNKKDEKCIIIVASVMESKNTMSFIKAYYNAFQQGCRTKVLWYGVIPESNNLQKNMVYTKECQKKIEEFGLENYFKLLPKRQDIQEAYREADVFCLPSHFEGTPNAICEAMASGLPIMASNVCDNARFVKPGKNGWLFDPKSIDDMFAVIALVADTPKSILYEYGNNSREIVESLCSEKDFISKYLKIISL